jgi:hypothetical protein
MKDVYEILPTSTKTFCCYQFLRMGDSVGQDVSRLDVLTYMD